MRALISVSNKAGLEPFAAALRSLQVEIFSTGNTSRHLNAAGIPVRSISDLTGFPEILDGRVKTLHPAVHAGILARRDLPAHMQTLAEHAIAPIDLVVVNLYPFAETITRSDAPLEQALEQIDIGGPTLLRAAAKNHPAVLVVVDPSDYDAVIAALSSGAADAALRRRLAAKAFAHTAAYDATIAAYLADDLLPPTLTLALPKAHDLRYGENPHQRGALYGDFHTYFEHLHGKELSYINILDISAAQELIEEFDPAEGVALTIVKHTNPCGVGLGTTPLEAWEHAYATDREAPFGGIIALNAPLDLPLARAIDELFTEILIAPAFTTDALALLRKKKNRRLIRVQRPIAGASSRLLYSVPGGLLVQEPDASPLAAEPFEVVTRRAPTDDEVRALRFAWRVVKHVKSNAIVYTSTNRTLGIGAGQMSRVDSSRVAVTKAQHAGLSLAGAAVASDALIPMPDGVEVAAAAGATAIVQPGGSIRDSEVIAAADRLGLAMVFTGRRHFRH